MEIKRIVTLVVLYIVWSSSILKAQEIDSSLMTYNWDENRQRIQLSTEEEQLPCVVMLKKSVVEFVLDNKIYVQYNLEHFVIRVNSDDAIETYNKIHIPMNGTIDIVNIRARSISKTGKIVNLNKDNIKEIKGDKKNDAYKIFAIEGVEKGCEIEYFYIKKTNVRVYNYDLVQFSAPVKKSFFQLIVPIHLKFKFKEYCGYPQVRDTVIHSSRIYTASGKDIKELAEEKASNFVKNRMRLEYKLAFNSVKGGNRELNGWEDAAQSKYQLLHTLTKKETSSVENLYDDLKLKKLTSEEKRITAIENYIKTTIVLQEIYSEDLSSLDKIIQNKFSNKAGIVKLYTALFRLGQINHQVVLTSSRTKIPFDGKFETNRYLNNFLFYFPATDKYITPEEVTFRYPMIPNDLTYTDGLFLKTVTVAGFETYISSVKFIKPLDYSSNAHNLEASLEFSPEMDSLKIKIACIFKGYGGTYTQPYYNMIPDDKKKLMLENIMKEYTKDTKNTRIYAENTDITKSVIDYPFTVHAELTSAALLESAGDKTLLKIGDILGKQVEMYQEKKRTMNVEDAYNREFMRDITIKIPAGYTIKNLNDLNINHNYQRSGEDIYKFTSSYTLRDNVLKIKIEEFYKELECTLDHYEAYRQVVNAAADFNKVILIFKKE